MDDGARRTRSVRVRKKSHHEDLPASASEAGVECTTWRDRLQGRRRFKRKIRGSKGTPITQKPMVPALPPVGSYRPELKALINLGLLAVAIVALYWLINYFGSRRLVIYEHENHSGGRLERFYPTLEEKP